MESQKIKENRRAKFLAKMEQKNKSNKKDTVKKQKPINNPSSLLENNPSISEKTNPSNTSPNTPKSQINQNQPNKEPDNNLKSFIENLNQLNKELNETFEKNQQNDLDKNNTNNTNNINNDIKSKNNNENDGNLKNESNNNQNDLKINIEGVLKKINQIDYMISTQNIFKKILIIILAIFHCLNFSPLNNFNVIKYTIIILEISSLFFNKYYNDQKKNLTKKEINPNINDRNNGKSNDKLEKLSLFLTKNFGVFDHIFMITKSIKDIMVDISILFLINIGFFLINKNA